MLDYGISITLVASALDEVAQNRDLIKLSAARDADERDLFQYLQDNLEDCHRRATSMSGDWAVGLRKYADDHNAHGLLKQAILGVDLHPAADIPLTLGAYMTPVLGTGLMTADALRNFYKMFGKKLGWKQRLGHGLMGLLDATFAGISLFPGAGAIGGSAKVGKLGSMLGKLGKPGAAVAKQLSKGVGLSARGAKAMRAASKAPGARGAAVRALGFGPAYKAGKIRNWFRSLAGKAPKTYVNPHNRLRQWERMLGRIDRLSPAQAAAIRRTGGGKGLLGLAESSGVRAARSPGWASMAVDNPAWRRVLLGMTPASIGSGVLSGMGPGPSYSTTETGRRLPSTVARHGKRVVPLIRNRRGSLRPAV